MTDNELLEKCENIHNMLDTMRENLKNAENTKLTTEVRLEKEVETFNSLKGDLKEIIGSDQIKDAEQYIQDKAQEMEKLINDMELISNQVTNDYQFTNDDVAKLKEITEKHGIQLESVG